MDTSIVSPRAWVHRKKRVERRLTQLRTDDTARAPLRLIAGGAVCGLLGAALAGILLYSEIAAGDPIVMLAMIPLSAAVIAVVTGWAGAMILVGGGVDNQPRTAPSTSV